MRYRAGSTEWQVGLLVAVAALLLLQSAVALAARRALLVGVGDYKYLDVPTGRRGEIADLQAPRSDVEAFKALLKEPYGFAETEIRVLVDKEATKQGIKEAWENWLVAGTKAGDMAIFYFAGHGSHVPDTSGDEIDGWDEVLCPYDTDRKRRLNLIVDDEFAQWLERLDGRQVVAVIDSCHSGGMKRHIGGMALPLEETGAYRRRFMPIAEDPLPPQAAGVGRRVRSEIPEGVIFMGAAAEDEAALELAGKEWRGVFTLGLEQAFRQFPSGSYQENFARAAKFVGERVNHLQHPIMLAPGKLERSTAFGGVALRLPPAPLLVVQAPPPPAPPRPHKPAQSSLSVPAAPAATAQPASYAVTERVRVRVDVLEGASIEDMRVVTRILETLPYVEVVTDVLFDRLIRGSVQNGRFSLRLVTPVGDAVLLPDGLDPEKVLENIVPPLEATALVKKLARLSQPQPPFLATLNTSDERCDYALGEKVVFRVETERDAYLVVLHVDAGGRVTVLYPNRRSADAIHPQGSLLIPDEWQQRHGFEFFFTAPAGEEAVKLIATNKPLDLQRLGLSGYGELFEAGRASAPARSSRDFVVGLVDEVRTQIGKDGFLWAEDTLVLRSHQKPVR